MSRPLNMSEVDWLRSEVERLKNTSSDDNKLAELNGELQRLKVENEYLRKQLSQKSYESIASETNE